MSYEKGKDYGPLWQLEQCLDGKLKLQASKRADAERYLKEAETLQSEIDQYLRAIDAIKTVKALQ